MWASGMGYHVVSVIDTKVSFECAASILRVGNSMERPYLSDTLITFQPNYMA
jgi:hypothetical protein